jgi:hypothetical protein
MSGTGRSNLSKNERGISQNWFGNNDPMRESDWTRSVNTVREVFDITSSSTNYSRGTTTTINIDKRGDRLGRTRLFFTRAAYTTGIPVDWEGPTSIQLINFKYQNKIFHTIYGEELVDRIKLGDLTELEKSNLAVLMGGMLSPSERLTNAGQAVSFDIDLLVPWRKLDNMLRIVALPNNIVVEITWQPLAQVVNNNGGTASGGAISNVWLRCDFHHLKNDKRMQLFSEIHSAPLSIKYLSREFHRREPLAANVSTNTITWSLKLRNIKNDVVMLYAYARPITAVDNSSGTTLDPYTHTSFTNLQYWLQDNGVPITNYFIQQPYQEYEEKYYALGDGFSHGSGQNYMVIPLTIDPRLVKKSERDCYGSRCISKYNNPEFWFSFTGSGSLVDSYVDVWADIHNCIIQYKGDIRRFLA